MATRSLTTEAGYRNRNKQRVLRRVDWVDSEMYGQNSYHLICDRYQCGYEYVTDGISIHQRLCPRCQSGKPGLPVPEAVPTLFG